MGDEEQGTPQDEQGPPDEREETDPPMPPVAKCAVHPGSCNHECFACLRYMLDVTRLEVSKHTSGFLAFMEGFNAQGLARAKAGLPFIHAAQTIQERESAGEKATAQERDELIGRALTYCAVLVAQGEARAALFAALQDSHMYEWEAAIICDRGIADYNRINWLTTEEHATEQTPVAIITNGDTGETMAIFTISDEPDQVGPVPSRD